MERFALQKLIAAQPAIRMSPKVAAQIDEAVEAIMLGLSDDLPKRNTKMVGPVLLDAAGRPQQMTMTLKRTGLQDVFDARYFMKENPGVGVPTGENSGLSLLNQLRPKNVVETSFGWADPDDKYLLPSYRDPDDVLRQAAQEAGIGKKLVQAYEDLKRESKLAPGDIISNSPYGLGRLDEHGKPDLKRTKRYMREGFGAADGTTQQLGVLDNRMNLQPVQMYTAHPQIMDYFGLKQQWA